MSLLAGVFTRNPQRPLRDSTCDMIRSTLSRNPEDEVRIFQDGRVFLAKVDVNAYLQPAFVTEPSSGSASMLVGEPLLALDEDPRRTRKEDLGMLHEEWSRSQ